MPHNQALTKAKMHLMKNRDTVFYTTILFSLKQEWDKNIKTACVDGITLRINPDFLLSLPVPQQLFLLVHEVLHVALNHMCRRGNKHPKVWNYAADYVVNLTLVKAKYQMILNDDGSNLGLLDRRFDGMNTEQVYDILWKEIEEYQANGGPGADGILIPGGEDIQYPEDSKEATITEKAVSDIIQKAVITAKAANEQPGCIPGEVLIELDRLTNPKLPWHVIMNNYLADFAKDDYSWEKINRRFLPDNYLPSAHSEALGEIAQAFDISGSVSPDEISYYVGETSEMMQMLHPDKVTILSFDTEITNIVELTEGSDIYEEMKLIGGGGTDITEVLEWAIENNPTVMLIFTDGYFHFPEMDIPTCPIVWLIHDNDRFIAPFGEVIHYDMVI